MLDYPWFKRRWIIQEVLHTHEPDRRSIWLGGYEMTWPYFMKVLAHGDIRVEAFPPLRLVMDEDDYTSTQEQALRDQRARTAGTLRDRWDRKVVRRGMISFVQSIAPQRSLMVDFRSASYCLDGDDNEDKDNMVQRRKLIRETLLENLWLCDKAECEDPRDCIFSLLSISRDANEHLVDYSSDSITVFTTTAERMILSKKTNNLFALLIWASTQPDRTEHNSLPSWVPDWGKSLRGKAPLEHDII